LSEIEAMADAVGSRDDWVTFVRALRREIESDAPDWTNTDLASFLEGLAAWVEDMPGYYRHQGQPTPGPEWRTFAQALAAARLYE
jgi:hypothetical protein